MICVDAMCVHHLANMHSCECCTFQLVFVCQNMCEEVACQRIEDCQNTCVFYNQNRQLWEARNFTFVIANTINKIRILFESGVDMISTFEMAD